MSSQYGGQIAGYGYYTKNHCCESGSDRIRIILPDPSAVQYIDYGGPQILAFLKISISGNRLE
jgi:hypothetical protein